MFNTIVRYVKTEFPDELHYMTLEHDISKVLEEIELEQAQLRPTNNDVLEPAADRSEELEILQSVQHNAEEEPEGPSTTPLTLDTMNTVPSPNANPGDIVNLRKESSLQGYSESEVSQPKKLSKRARLKAWFKSRAV